MPSPSSILYILLEVVEFHLFKIKLPFEKICQWLSMFDSLFQKLFSLCKQKTMFGSPYLKTETQLWWFMR